MTRLDTILNPADLADAIRDGYVRVQHHPRHHGMAIFNYTEKAAFESQWNPVTLTCRGLIVDGHGTVIARPFGKFFNYGQTGAPVIDLDAPAVVTDKQDGSLGILYPNPDGWAIATRGSFTSEQAVHATAILNGRYPQFQPEPGRTYLWEIIYPGNRIVVDYGPFDDLVLLGAVDIATGRSIPLTDCGAWQGPVTETLPYTTLAQALAAGDRDGREGVVVHATDSDTRIKIKQAEYVRLHRIVTGLNARSVWEPLAAGESLDALIESLPDEFHTWVKEVAEELTAMVVTANAEAALAYSDLVASLPDGWDRKTFAEHAKQLPDAWALFAYLDGKSILPKLWANAKPSGDWTPAGRPFGEDTA